jgi:hypothetical protein
MKDPVQVVKLEMDEKIRRGSSYFNDRENTFNQANQRLVPGSKRKRSGFRIVRNK